MMRQQRRENQLNLPGNFFVNLTSLASLLRQNLSFMVLGNCLYTFHLRIGVRAKSMEVTTVVLIFYHRHSQREYIKLRRKKRMTVAARLNRQLLIQFLRLKISKRKERHVSLLTPIAYWCTQ